DEWYSPGTGAYSVDVPRHHARLFLDGRRLAYWDKGREEVVLLTGPEAFVQRRGELSMNYTPGASLLQAYLEGHDEEWVDDPSDDDPPGYAITARKVEGHTQLEVKLTLGLDTETEHLEYVIDVAERISLDQARRRGLFDLTAPATQTGIALG